MDQNAVAVPWWQSKIIIGIVVSLVCKAIIISGLTNVVVDSGTQTQITNTLLALLGGAGDLYAIAKRVTQKTAPQIVASNSKAATLNQVGDGTEGGPWPLGQ